MLYVVAFTKIYASTLTLRPAHARRRRYPREYEREMGLTFLEEMASRPETTPPRVRGSSAHVQCVYAAATQDALCTTPRDVPNKESRLRIPCAGCRARRPVSFPSSLPPLRYFALSAYRTMHIQCGQSSRSGPARQNQQNCRTFVFFFRSPLKDKATLFVFFILISDHIRVLDRMSEIFFSDFKSQSEKSTINHF